jgi:pyruvate/2-oxoglutarate dehydrogenase complex dihydrolipoamide dehydrogenase (E3) component
MTRIVVAGSGTAGLACAAALAGDVETTLVERLPVIGGEHWDEPRIAELRAEAERAGVRMLPGCQVLRSTGERVLVVGVTTAELPADALVVATGHRPMTAAEAGIAGPRLAGVLPATVALHLLEHGVLLGRRPLVLGPGGLADEAAAHLRAAGAEDVALLNDGRILRLEGSARVEAAWIERHGAEPERVEADAVVLARGRIPYRNVDGAVLPAPGVVFAQPRTEPRDGPEVEAAGRAAAAEALAAADVPRTPAEPPLRIGGPR